MEDLPNEISSLVDFDKAFVAQYIDHISEKKNLFFLYTRYSCHNEISHVHKIGRHIFSPKFGLLIINGLNVQLDCTILSYSASLPLQHLFVQFLFLSNIGLHNLLNSYLIRFLPAAGKLFNLQAVFSHSQSGQLGTKLLSIVLLPIRNILLYPPCALSIGTQEMLQFRMQLVLCGIADSYLLLLQLPSSKLLKLQLCGSTSSVVVFTTFGSYLFSFVYGVSSIFNRLSIYKYMCICCLYILF